MITARRALACAGAALAAAGTLHAAWNLHRIRRPVLPPPVAEERVSVLLPLRDEAHRVAPGLRSLLGQTSLVDLELLVLDDGSTDGTAEVVRSVAGDDPRLRLVDGGASPPPEGWLGKPWACPRLADAAHGRVLVFVDADVVVEPDGVAATVDLLRRRRLDLVCPYPRQLAESPAERLVQPLLQWSWLTTLPLRLAERSPRPTLSAANGQLLAVDAAAYRRAGGHGAVRDEVLDDVGLLRAVKRAGGRGVVADGTLLATCRMYDGAREVYEGYTKSLWAAFGSPAGALGVVALLVLAYVAPPALALAGGDRTTRALGAAGYAAGVAGRALVARGTGGRTWPDALAHPVSVSVFGASPWRPSSGTHAARWLEGPPGPVTTPNA